MSLIGRQSEKIVLERLLQSKSAEFLAVYGRRRVGKTFLIREYFRKEIAFELTGIQDAKLKEQLNNFHSALYKRCKASAGEVRPSSWQEAFERLAEYLEKLPKKKKQVIFLDELPWLAGHKSKFLPALDFFWNSFVSRHPNLILIVCGSAASWMISKLVNHRGGLHNRITARLRLEPFSLAEAEKFLKSRGIQLTHYDQLMLGMVFGGIPHYLKEIQPGQSAAQAIDEVCFSKNGLLKDEFTRLYQSLFDHPERHVEIIRLLAKNPQGLDRNRLAKVYSTGGGLTNTLEELYEAGFISKQQPFGKKTKDTLYRLVDEYSLFYIRWIEKHRGDTAGTFLRIQSSPSWRSWSGYALESLAQGHLGAIKRELGIANVAVEASGWIHRPNKNYPQGLQIDLLLDRADRTINLIEIKFSQGPFTINKKYAEELRKRLETFKRVSGTRSNVFLTFLTTHGLQDNAYAKELAHQSITTDCLFKET